MNSLTDFILFLVGISVVGFFFMAAARKLIDWIMRKIFDEQ